MKKICVFAGSNPGNKLSYASEAKRLGKLLADKQIDLVYGGSCKGLMGAVADQVIESGGNVIGVMPSSLFSSEIVHQGLTELIEVSTMHERKAKMGELADAFIALPGGYGTFEELFEVVCWSQIGLHHKPIGVLNIDEFYTPLLNLVKHAAKEGFMNPSYIDLIISSTTSSDLLEKLALRDHPVYRAK
ncbi:TIGR00730 family Rossman fold protein [Heyndrickxia acidicola]|uniref:Cytokinin riboside 5'-monophosphate phosphoribohydrolase n=1 Tax=Heyndrickxia acidicola TaxID=209389 RepID=A0ABU6MM75_9BACI|nr:TIGR00730 family Rossman fold protein [Heyndrickxia acidicola]MED1205507.1 TIGR00730 family Rossman fold protein [Heyndrickxia acidicola]